MSMSTGIVLATGAVQLGNIFVFNETEVSDPVNEGAKVVVATGIVAGTLALVERGAPDLAVAMGWAIFVGMMLTRLNPEVPSPTERIIKWWETANR